MSGSRSTGDAAAPPAEAIARIDSFYDDRMRALHFAVANALSNRELPKALEGLHTLTEWLIVTSVPAQPSTVEAVAKHAAAIEAYLIAASRTNDEQDDFEQCFRSLQSLLRTTSMSARALADDIYAEIEWLVEAARALPAYAARDERPNAMDRRSVYRFFYDRPINPAFRDPMYRSIYGPDNGPYWLTVGRHLPFLGPDMADWRRAAFADAFGWLYAFARTEYTDNIQTHYRKIDRALKGQLTERAAATINTTIIRIIDTMEQLSRADYERLMRAAMWS